MNSKVVLITFIWLFMLSAISRAQFASFARAQERTVGVKVGDWVKYELMASFVSDDPNVQLPLSLIKMNETEWIMNTVQAISGTKITFERVIHYEDGNEAKSVEYVDVDTGRSSVNGSLMFIPSNLGKDDLVHASLTEQYSINETIRRTYIGVTRDINFLTISTAYPGVSDTITITTITANYYWDKVTGILCERPGTVVTSDGTYTTSFAMSEKIIDTNVWAVGETLPLSLIAALVIVILLLVSLGLWRVRAKK